MCGIFGFSGKKDKAISLTKLTILGLYNLQRGVHSCGYYLNGHIAKGVNDEANFGDFVAKNNFKSGGLDCSLFMGHTRHATGGAHTTENAHPHMVNNYVQTHNGVIKNIWALCKDHDINHTSITVDSIGLAHIIQKDGFKVLDKYEGFAALAMTFTDDPECLYLYHGASKEFKHGEMLEERPMYFLQASEGIYYSSMLASLEAINKDKRVKPETLAYNKVVKIRNGEIVGIVYEAKREEANVTKVTVYTNYSETEWDADKRAWVPKSGLIQQGIFPAKTETKPVGSCGLPQRCGANTKTQNGLGAIVRNIGQESLILTETYPLEAKAQDIYYRRGRYYRGLNVLLHGEYKIDRDGNLITDGKKTNRENTSLYFIKGVMMKDLRHYRDFITKHGDTITDMTINFAIIVSKYSRYAVCSIENEGLNLDFSYRKMWYKDAERYSGTITVRFAKRTYEVKAGLLHHIHDKIQPMTYIKNKQMQHIVSVLDTPETPVPLPRPTADELVKSCLSTENKEIAERLNTDINTNINAIIDHSNANRLKLFEDIMDLFDRRILTSEITDLPEALLIFLDYFTKTFFTGKPTPEEVEKETETLLTDLLISKLTLHEYFKEFYKPGFGSMENLIECFRSYPTGELIVAANRYEFKNFPFSKVWGKIGKDEDTPNIEEAIVTEDINPAQEISDNITNAIENDLFPETSPKVWEVVKRRRELTLLIQQLNELKSIADDQTKQASPNSVMGNILNQLTPELAKEEYQDLKKLIK